ncbi:TIGR03663 family protein [Halopenitus malekzadehii]|uniref:TIGR03663 family protein n=1 Tax=Halopenitus malekzadehii TaxID=1267564 RepID=A0A1H6I1K8_9EURY|nr:flippase activity-associated protein Agl23 [Halopenitus malekzadehii]SEH40401.1 TIGR03663 family protein [Halopenitus malekzadehii]
MSPPEHRDGVDQTDRTDRTGRADAAGRRTLGALAAVTILSLVLRLYDLGGRVFHWDEGRVGYWTLRYVESGHLEYEPIIHGPFLRIVNAAVFGVLPPTDASARLVVALVGGLLPLSVWLFRAHLDRWELVSVAGLLACSPLLVYYSRFMRNDVLVGGFAFVALGFTVRAIDTRRARYLYPGAVALSLSLATKANTILYVLCFLGAGALIADHRIVRRVIENVGADGEVGSASGNGPTAGNGSVSGNGPAAGTDRGRAIRRDVAAWIRARWRGVATVSGRWHPVGYLLGHAVGVVVAFLAVTVFFYAPRPLLHEAVGSPGLWPTVLHEATVGSAEKLADLWLTGEMQDNPYLQFLHHELETLTYTAPVTLAFAVVGFLVDGHVRGRGRVPAGRRRALVAFATYWGLASLVGYPAATDINAPWSAVHIVLPLTIPAGVGLAYVAREGWAAVERPSTPWSAPRVIDRETAILAVFVLLAATAGVIAPTATYWNSTNPDHTAAVQWAQPHNDARSTIADVEAVAAAHDDGVDILFVGTHTSDRENVMYVGNESAADRDGAPGGWYDRLPLPWYYERAGATVDSVSADADRATALADPPPVVIVHESGRAAVAPHLEGYRVTAHEFRLWNFRLVFFIEEAALREAGRLE